MNDIKTPMRCSGAIEISAPININGEERIYWVGVPIVELNCPNCKTQVNSPDNGFAINNHTIDPSNKSLIGGMVCNTCGLTFNKTKCYFDYISNNNNLKFLSLSILGYENPKDIELPSKGFLPGKLSNNIWIAEGAKLGRNVKIVQPGILINKNTIISDNCTIGPCVYLENAKIDKMGLTIQYCDIKNSTVRRNVSNCSVHNSVAL